MIQTIIAGLKKQKELNHVGLTCREHLFDLFLKTLVMPKKPALSLNLRNSKLSQNSANILKKLLENPDVKLTALSLKFTFLDWP